MAEVKRATIHLLCIMTAFAIAKVEGQIIGLGSCPAVTRAAGTNANTLLRRWFEVRRFHDPNEHYFRCVSYTFTRPAMAQPRDRGSLQISGVRKLTGRTVTATANTRFPPGTFSVVTVDFPLLNIFPNNYEILGFSNNNWVVLYSCTNYGFFFLMQVVVLTAARRPTAAVIDAALDVVSSNKLPRVLLRRVKQSFC